MVTTVHVLSSQRLQLVLQYLAAPEAFGLGNVCRSFAKALEATDAKPFLQGLRPKAWRSDVTENLSQEFCRRLLREWHLCLKHSACQVGYVMWDQHLVFVEPSASLVPAPQGSDPFPVSVDRTSYKLSIEEFHWDCLWWTCLENELFHWPQEVQVEDDRVGDRGYRGDQDMDRPVDDPVMVSRRDEDDNRGRADLEDEFAGRRAPDEDDNRGRADLEDEFAGRRAPDEDDNRGRADLEDEFAGRRAPDEDLDPRARNPDTPTFKVVAHELEAVPGYRGDMSLPNLKEDVLAVLSLNAAWFSYSFWTRQLQAILLLRDGRFLLIGSCEMQGTIESQASARVFRCFVSDSLLSLVTFAQDPRSRQILRTRLPDSTDDSKDSDCKPGLDSSMRMVKLPRVNQEDRKSCEATFGAFLKAQESSEGGVLFSTLQLNQAEMRKSIKAGDTVRVKRAGKTIIWKSCVCTPEDQLKQGPADPKLEEEMLQRTHRQERRWISYSGGCHLGLSNGRSYDAQVVEVLANGLVDLQYTDPDEWGHGNSGFTNSLGCDRKDPYIEADVEVERIQMMPDSRWYWSFKTVWEPCGGFSSVSLDFGSRGEGGMRCFPGGISQSSSRAEDQGVPFRKLADVFADSMPAHRFRCGTLSQEKDVLSSLAEPCDIEDLLGSVECSFPRQKHMALGKDLFFKLLRVPSFWKKWVDEGGESPTFVTTLFRKEKFVRLVIE